MRSSLLLQGTVLLTACAALAGCSAVSTTSTTPVPAGTYANWQIQSSTAISPPPVGLYMTGSLQTTGSTVNGVFSTHLACTPQVATLTGTLSSSGVLTLGGIGIQSSLQVASNPYTPSTGTLTAGGYLCQAITSGSAVGFEIAPLNGTRNGAVTATTVAPIASGNVSLAVTQSTTPNSQGQFPLTGTLTFTATGCTQVTPVTGYIGGEDITLATTPGSPSGTADVAVTAWTIPTATTVTAASITFTPNPCSTTSSATYTGTLQ